jgi:hypothetical protein
LHPDPAQAALQQQLERIMAGVLVKLSEVSEDFWLVVWNMAFIFPYIGNNNPN